MGKKKRQGDPSRDGAESTDSEEEGGEERGLPSCPHVGKAVCLGAVKKTLKIAWVKVGQCTMCNKESKTVSSVKKLDHRGLKKTGGKPSLAEIKKEQLERAKAEQRAAAEKLKREREQKEKPESVNDGKKDEESTDENKVQTEEKKEEATKPVEAPTMWLCLKCGSQGCSNNPKQHSEGHYRVPRSDLHCLAVNIATWAIWCFECKKEIYVDSHKKLYEVVEAVKKVKEQGVKQVVLAPKGPGTAAFGALTPLGRPGGAPGGTATYTKGGILRVKGLSNLGNTCFFNSVMQCLNQTHLLTSLLDLQAAKGVSLEVPGTEAAAETSTASTNDDSEGDVEATLAEMISGLSVQLAEGGPMVTSLAAFFKEMASQGKSASFSPGQLFQQVVRQAPRFRGMQQQDSHELLRYLMDGLRSEEQKRQKSAILKNFGLTEKTDPKSVAKCLRRKLRVYGRQANHTLLDRIFSGQLVSTIVCEECHHSSRRYEQFLDISLPVVEDKPHKPHAKKAASQGDTSVTCCGVQEAKKKTKTQTQIKKEKARLKKEKRKGKKNLDSKSTTPLEEEEGEATEEENLADEEVNDDDEKKIKDELRCSEKSDRLMPTLEEEVKVITSGGFRRQESLVAESLALPWLHRNGAEAEPPEEQEQDWEWDYGEEKEDKQTVRAKTPAAKIETMEEESDYIDTSENETTLKLEEDTETVEGSDEDLEDEETGASSNGDVEDNTEDEGRDWVVGKNYLNNLKQLDDLMKVTDNLDPHMEELCRGMASLGAGEPRLRRQVERERVEREWTARTLTTLAPRYQAAAGECSVYSCLNGFTQSELLTGSNKWACEHCTRLAAAEATGGSEDKPATVYSSASKQMLIFSPPAVLTLQLKRFQQTLQGVKKVNKHVTFPLQLDLAAFCSSTSVAMPNMELGSQVLYSLYGVVEHSGSLRSGHYVAYVRVRPATEPADLQALANPPLARPSDVPAFLEEIDRKLRRKTAARIDELEKDNKESKEEVDETNNNKTNGQKGKKWFHVSDSSVSEVSEARVLGAQAYLLFYERLP